MQFVHVMYAVMYAVLRAVYDVHVKLSVVMKFSYSRILWEKAPFITQRLI